MKKFLVLATLPLFWVSNAYAFSIDGPEEITLYQGKSLREYQVFFVQDAPYPDYDQTWTIIEAPKWVKGFANTAVQALNGTPTKVGDYEVQMQVIAKDVKSNIFTVTLHVLSSAPELAEPDTTQVYQTKYNPGSTMFASPVIKIDLLTPNRATDVDEFETTVTGLPDGANWGYTFITTDAIILYGPWTKVGVYPVSVTFTTKGGSDTVSFDLEVISGAPVIDTLQEAIELDVGEPFERDYTYSGAGSILDNTEIELAGELPEGMSYSAFSAPNLAKMAFSIKGAPTVKGVYPLTLTVRNDYGEDSKDFTIYVGVKAPGEQTIAHIALGPDLNEIVPGLAYSQWFGFVFTANAPWVYNYELGWCYLYEGTTSYDDVWMYNVGNPGLGWMYGGDQYDGFFYFETSPGTWGWQWLYTGAVDLSTPGGPPTNP